MLDLASLGLTPEQHARRARGIGGSEAGTIVSGDWYHLWEQKTGRAGPDDLSNILAVIMGIYTEDLNLAWFAKQTGRAVTRLREQVTHPTIPYLGVTLDGFSCTEMGFPAPVNAKHVSRADEAMEIRYTAQGTHEAIVTDCDHYMFSVFVGNNKWELFESEVDPFFAEEYLSLCEQFWQHVASDTPPATVTPLPVPAPRRLRTVDMEGNNEFASYALDWLRLRGAAKAFDSAAKSLKGLVDLDVGLCHGYGIQIKRGRNDALYISEMKQ